MADTDIKSLGSVVWSIAELLRGDLKQSEYGKVVLPFVVLRRLDCILAHPRFPSILGLYPGTADAEALQKGKTA